MDNSNGNSSQFMESQARFNDLIDITASSGKRLLGGQTNLDAYARNELESQQYFQQSLVGGVPQKSLNQRIRENATQDLRELGMDVQAAEQSVDEQPQFDSTMVSNVGLQQVDLAETQAVPHFQSTIGVQPGLAAQQGEQEAELAQAQEVQAQDFSYGTGEAPNNWSTMETRIREHDLQHTKNTNLRRTELHGEEPVEVFTEDDNSQSVVVPIYGSIELILPVSASTRYDREPLNIQAGERAVVVSPETLVNRYHELKQSTPAISRDTLKFISSRLNPPRCVALVLDALCGLLFGIYDQLDLSYYAMRGEKRYSLFKKYMYDLDSFSDCLTHLKLFLETQGIPLRNVQHADTQLVKYFKAIKRVDNQDYINATNEIAQFVVYFVEYFQILSALELEPLQRRPDRLLNHTTPLLKNMTRKDWSRRVVTALPENSTFSEQEYIALIESTTSRKIFKIIRSLDKPFESTLFCVKALHTLFASTIQTPPYKIINPWPWYKKTLRTQIPALVETLPQQLQDGTITQDQIVAAEKLVRAFTSSIVTRKEVNNSFLMQYETRIMNLIVYSGRLHRLYHKN